VSKPCKCPCHQPKCPCHQPKGPVTINLFTQVNGGPLSDCGRITVNDGDTVTICQPVVVDFASGGAPFRVGEKGKGWEE
jgi:hypothetical protein